MAVADLPNVLQTKSQGPLKARGPVAIVDIGSNSVRLVIYESQTRVAATLQNEKSICAIGRDMVTTGRLHAEGCAAALEALSRFRMMADGLKVEHREAVATAAARDASNGAEFIGRAERAWGGPVRILAGEDEARIAAEGVVAGIAVDARVVRRRHRGHLPQRGARSRGARRGYLAPGPARR